MKATTDPSRKGWIGFDLDATLALYERFQGPGHIGEPVPVMLQTLKALLDAGEDCYIFTARVWAPEVPQAHDDDDEEAIRKRAEALRRHDEALTARHAIEKWCEKHVGKILPVTCEKDYGMKYGFDDRIRQVIPNVGITYEECLKTAVQYLDKLNKRAKDNASFAIIDSFVAQMSVVLK